MIPRWQRLQEWYGTTFGQAMIGCGLLWAALPPLGRWLWPLAWIAPLWWVLLIRRRQLPVAAVPAWPKRRTFLFLLAWCLLFLAWMAAVGLWNAYDYRWFWVAEIVFWPAALWFWFIAARRWSSRPYSVLWLAGFFFWLSCLYWLRFPHWATGFGWLALSFYFAFYFPVWIGLCRVAVQRLHVPVIIAAPVVWTGLELARAHLLTGMTMASLGHTQYRWTTLIQFSDLTGAFGVSFLVMFVAACLGRMVPCDNARRALWPLLPVALALAAAWGYGQWRTSGQYTQSGGRVALIQGSVDTRMEYDQAMQPKIRQQYLDLSLRAVAGDKPVDLVVWPETMFRAPLIACDPGFSQPPEYAGMPADGFRRNVEQAAWHTRYLLATTAGTLHTALIVGLDRQHFARGGMQIFNSAAFVSREGKLLGQYDKIHRVMFGEYVPFADRFPWLQGLTPLPVSLSPGQSAAMFTLGRLRIAPNICYETVLPHVIRRQINQLRAEGSDPNVLVNLTNDGWFWGSNELDMHLACGVFRAVECRKPLLIAANTGLSAWIDGDGRVRLEAPRRTPCVLLADVQFDQRGSWYLDHGDWLAGTCLAACLLLAIAGTWPRLRSPLPRGEG